MLFCACCAAVGAVNSPTDPCSAVHVRCGGGGSSKQEPSDNADYFIANAPSEAAAAEAAAAKLQTTITLASVGGAVRNCVSARARLSILTFVFIRIS